MWGLGVSYNPARQGGKRPLRNVGMVVNTEKYSAKAEERLQVTRLALVCRLCVVPRS